MATSKRTAKRERLQQLSQMDNWKVIKWCYWILVALISVETAANFITNDSDNETAVGKVAISLLLMAVLQLLFLPLYLIIRVIAIRAYVAKPKGHEKPETGIAKIEYLAMSPKRLALLTLLTLGLYDLYWFYKNWRAVKEATSQKMSPFWRAVFSPFYAWPLFKEVRDSAWHHGYKQYYSAKFLGLLYLASVLTGTALSRVPDYNILISIAAMFTLLTALLPLIFVQKAINFNNQHSALKSTVKRSTSRGEVAMIGVGIIVALLALYGWFAPPAPAVTDEVVSPELQAQIDSKKKLYDSLTSQYKSCSSDLTARRDTVDNTDQAAIDAYNQDYDVCESTRVQQNAAADDYNKLIGR